MFPIKPSGPKFRNERWRLKGVGRSPAAAIERLQPYHRRKKPAACALLQLEELRNVDQHRLLHPTAMHRDWARYTLLSGRNEIVPGDFRAFNRPLEENAPLARFDVVTTVAEPKVIVEDNAAVDIVFGKGSPAESVREESVIATLSAIRTYLQGEVLPTLLPWLGGAGSLSHPTRSRRDGLT